jgi:putative SOS response-associated peptidase YedK
MAAIHDRMPAILRPEHEDLWLRPSVREAPLLLPLLQPYPDEAMEAYPVSRLVNSPTVDDPACIQPAGQGELL